MNTRNTQRTPHRSQSKSVRFVRLRLNDYGIFQGLHEFEFNRKRTVIVGTNGSGRTTAAQALVHLGPVRGYVANKAAQNPRMFVEVETSGDRQLIQQYRDLIYLSAEAMCELALKWKSAVTKILNRTQRNHVSKQTPIIFADLMDRHLSDWDGAARQMPSGRRIGLGVSVVLAMREVLDLDIPVVSDDLSGQFTKEHLLRVRNRFAKIPHQQIMFCPPYEAEEIGKSHYRIDRPNENR